MYRSELTKLKLYQEDGCYYLRAEYEVEDDHRLQKYTIPKIALPIRRGPVINERVFNEYCHHYSSPKRDVTMDLGFGELHLLTGSDGYLYKCETIKEYPQKMTLEEIEKKLGYKVEIVSGK